MSDYAVDVELFEELTQVVDDQPHAAALNMAIDEVLLRSATRPLLRIYCWQEPAVSFGYFGKYERVRQVWPARELVRRWTGGGTVPHGNDLTYTLVVPASSTFFHASPRDSYRLIHERIAAALQRSGHLIHLAPKAEPKISDECFHNPARHDLLRAGRKFAGAAQRRTHAGLLHQGSIQDPHLAESLHTLLADAFSSRVEARPIHQDELAAAEILSRDKYATAAWLQKY